jgi:spore coat polysaccharide biosynthesis protein SpsF
VIADLAGRPMLVQQLRRLGRAQAIDEIVVATTTESRDDVVAELAEGEGLRCFRGSEQDVLSRYVEAARASSADVVVRLTADCPLIDPGVVDKVTEMLVHGAERFDYGSNVVSRTYPQGLDTEALFTDTLERIHRLATSTEAREHVTWYAYVEQPELFLIGSVTDDADNSDLRWTVDTPDDLERVRRLYEALDLGDSLLDYRSIVTYVRERPTSFDVQDAESRRRNSG